MARKASDWQRLRLLECGDEIAKDPDLTYKTASKRLLRTKRPRESKILRPTRAETLVPHTTFHQREAVRRRDGVCRYCGGDGPFEVDHVFPVWYGGTSITANLVLACKPCNTDKGPLLDWWGIRKLAAEDHEWAKKALLRAESLDAVRRWAEART